MPPETERVDAVMDFAGDPGRQSDARFIDETQARTDDEDLGEFDQLLLSTFGRRRAMEAQLVKGFANGEVRRAFLNNEAGAAPLVLAKTTNSRRSVVW